MISYDDFIAAICKRCRLVLGKDTAAKLEGETVVQEKEDHAATCFSSNDIETVSYEC